MEGVVRTSLEFGVSPLVEFEAAQPLVSDIEDAGEGGDGDACGLSLSPQRLALGRSAGVWVEQDVVDLVGDVAFEAAGDVAVGQAFGAAALVVGGGAGFLVAFAAHDDAVQGGVGLPVAAAAEAVAGASA